jgi:hypothetical protein
VDLTRSFSQRGLIAVALGLGFFAVRSTILRFSLLGGLVTLFFLLRGKGGKAGTLSEGIAEFSERLPGIGGVVSRRFVHK